MSRSLFTSPRSVVAQAISVIAQAIAPKTVLSQPTAADHKAEAEFMNKRIQGRVSQYNQEEVGHQDVLRGHISCDDITDFISDYSKSAVCSLASWSALAKAYNAYVKNPKDTKLEAFFSEFHAWNAVNPQQMDEVAVMETCARLTQVAPTKGNDQTDAIIARVRKVSVEELRAEREKKAKADTARREELLEQFVTAVWSHVFSEHNFQFPAAKVEAKLVDTMTWIANWQSNNPAAQAAELLLIEADLKMVRKIASRDVGNSEDFVDGVLTTDHMMHQNERAA